MRAGGVISSLVTCGEKTNYVFSEGGLGGAAWPLVGAGGRVFGGASSSPSVNSLRTVLLAKRSSRRIFPAARMTSGIRSGPITISATARISIISSGFKLR